MYSIGLIIIVRERKFHANFDDENKSSRERKFPGTKVPGEESSWGRMFQGTKVPRKELSFPGTKVLGYESSSYRVGNLCDRPPNAIPNHRLLFHTFGGKFCDSGGNFLLFKNTAGRK